MSRDPRRGLRAYQHTQNIIPTSHEVIVSLIFCSSEVDGAKKLMEY